MRLGGDCTFNEKNTDYIKNEINRLNGGSLNVSALARDELKKYYCRYVCKNILC